MAVEAEQLVHREEGEDEAWPDGEVEPGVEQLQPGRHRRGRHGGEEGGYGSQQRVDDVVAAVDGRGQRGSQRQRHEQRVGRHQELEAARGCFPRE